MTSCSILRFQATDLAADDQEQQVAPNPRRRRFSTETPLERERRLKISVNNEGQDVNKKRRSRENVA